MITSKKGVESFPFFLFLSLLIASFVISIGFYQVGTFSEFSSKKEIADSYKELTSAMENLRSTADYGSFTRINFKISDKYSLTISANNSIFIKGPSMDLNNTPGFDILGITDKYGDFHESYKFEKGEYEIIVYYGNYTQETSEPYQIYFI